jgi:hypothetical protein
LRPALRLVAQDVGTDLESRRLAGTLQHTRAPSKI